MSNNYQLLIKSKMELSDVHYLETRFGGLEMIPKDMTCPTPGRSKKPLHAKDSRFVILSVIYEKPTKRARCNVGHGRRVKCPPTPRKRRHQKASGKKTVKIGSCPFPSLDV